jgi:hypothetical protein
MNALVRPPSLASAPGADGWAEETVTYRVLRHPRPKFNSVVDAAAVFAGGEGRSTVTTRVLSRPPAAGEIALQLSARITVGGVLFEDSFDCVWRDGLAPGRLTRTVGEGRRKEIDFQRNPFPLPPATYPEVLLPFLMRGQPRDGERRTLCSWTSDRFVARVYYESRERKTLDVPAGRIASTLVWMYPDLNDWVPLGGVINRLAKPFLPRYEMWFEDAAPHRVVRFEGAFGPPGAIEILMLLDG